MLNQETSDTFDDHQINDIISHVSYIYINHANHSHRCICLPEYSADTCARINFDVYTKWNVDFGIW
jgi:hypothetical protein